MATYRTVLASQSAQRNLVLAYGGAVIAAPRIPPTFAAPGAA